MSTAEFRMDSSAPAEVFEAAYCLSVNSNSLKQTKALVAELSLHFYGLGWLPGTGGSVSVKVHEHNVIKQKQFIIMTPSGVQKDRLSPEDMYVVSSSGSILSQPTPKPFPHNPPKWTECAPLFLRVYEMCDAGAVIHSHGLDSCLVTMLDPSSKEFRIKNMETIKGIKGHGYNDELVLPIIDNAPSEEELVEPLTAAIRAYPKSTAVLVRRHGVFIWGDNWISAKTQAECYHYLFAAAIKHHQLNFSKGVRSSKFQYEIEPPALGLMAREREFKLFLPGWPGFDPPRLGGRDKIECK